MIDISDGAWRGAAPTNTDINHLDVDRTVQDLRIS